MISIMYSLLLVPLFSAMLIFLIPNSRKETFRPIGIAFSLITLTQCVYLLFGEYAKTEFTILSTFKWIQSYGINLHFGLSGISTLLLLLSSLLVFVSFCSSSPLAFLAWPTRDWAAAAGESSYRKV